VFAGKRDDPFFNNVRGTRAAYQRAAAAVRNGAATDAAGCPSFDAQTTAAILSEWRHTDGGDAKDFLEGWTPASLVVSIDIDRVAKQGPILGVWATTSSAVGQLDRVGRPDVPAGIIGDPVRHSLSDLQDLTHISGVFEDSAQTAPPAQEPVHQAVQ